MHGDAGRARLREEAIGHGAGTLARATRHDDEGRLGDRAAESRLEHGFVVREDIASRRFTAVLGDRRRQDGRVAVVDAADRQRLPRGHQLVSRGKDRDARSTHHGDLRQARRGEHADLARRDECAPAQQGLAARDVAAGVGQVGAGRDRAGHGDHRTTGVVLRLRVLDHDHGIGAARQHAAGGDRRRRAVSDLDGRRYTARQHLGVEPQAARRRLGRAREVAGPHGEAVDRRAIEGRRVRRGGDRLGQDTVMRSRERHRFGRQRRQVQHRMPAQHGFVGGDDFEKLFLTCRATDPVEQPVSARRGIGPSHVRHHQSSSSSTSAPAL